MRNNTIQGGRPPVDFLLAGGTKSGTESIFIYFDTHVKEVKSRNKQSHFFCQGLLSHDYVGLEREMGSLQEYVDSAPVASAEEKIGDFDCLTLHGPRAANLIHAVNPLAKVMLILRNPIERAYSHYWMDVRECFESRPFYDAIREDYAEYSRGSKKYCPLVRLGYYADSIQKFKQELGGGNLKVWLYDDYCAHPDVVLSQMCEFIGVAYVPLSQTGEIRENVASIPSSRFSAMLFRARLTWLRPWREMYLKLPAKLRRFLKSKFLTKRIKVPPMSAAARQFLTDIYKDEILELSQLLGRDFSHWMRDPARPMTLPTEFQELQKSKQAQYYDEATDDEFEIERPRGTGRLYQWSIQHKFDTAFRQLGFSLRGQRVLDICCGSGMAAEFYARAGADVTGLDISEKSIARAGERAKRHQFNATFVVGDAENLPYPDMSFDVVTVHDGLHHLPDPHRAVREMLRVAKRAIIVIEPARSWLTRRAVSAGMALDYEDAGNYVYRFREEEIFELARDAGYARLTYKQYLLYYRHEPFKNAKYFDRTPLFHVIAGLFKTSSAITPRLGNKINVICERPLTGTKSARK